MIICKRDSEPEHFFPVAFSTKGRIHDHKSKSNAAIIVLVGIADDQMPHKPLLVILGHKGMKPSGFKLRFIISMDVIPGEGEAVNPVSGPFVHLFRGVKPSGNDVCIFFSVVSQYHLMSPPGDIASAESFADHKMLKCSLKPLNSESRIIRFPEWHRRMMDRNHSRCARFP